MAQLKNTIILGDLSVTGAAHLAETYTDTLNVPTTSNGTTFGPGTNGQILTSNGSKIYWSSSATPASHTHGKITNAGAIANSDNVAIANNDRLVIADSSDSYILKNTSIVFDGSTATKALTQKGTWETFNNYSHPTYTSKTSALYKITVDGTGHVSGTASVAESDIPALSASKITSGTFDAARIPNLDASKITSGTFADARIASASTWNAKQDALTFDGTYNSSGNKVATVSTVTNAIQALDVSNISGFGAGKTLSALSETDGKISATFQDISITKSQVSDFPTSMTPTSHAHGKITNAGAIASTDNVAIANNDRLIIADSSDSYVLKNTSIVFDGSTATKALTQKGTWETFNNYSHPTGDGNLHVPATGTSNNGKVLKAGSTAGSISWGSLTASDVGATAVSIVDSTSGTTSTTNLTQLVINKLTKAQYDAIATPDSTQLYLITDDTIYATKTYVDNLITNIDALPSQSGNSGKYLTTNGTTASWATINALPSQSGNSGKFLTTNGTTASWTTPSGTWGISITGSSASCTGNAATATTASSCSGNAATVSRATFGDSGNGTHDANAMTSNGLYYYTSNGPATSIGAGSTDGAIYCQAYNASWVGQIAQDYRDGDLFIRGRNSGTWQSWKRVWVTGDSVTGAVWNDYAEYRETDTQEFGRCVIENGDDTMSLSTQRLQKGCSITSDTWGFAQGKTEKAKTPIAVSGRVLAYPFEDKEEFRKHIGDAVCSGPEGTVSIMTDEEIQKYPLSIIGTISAVPDYEEWGGGSDRGPVKVNGRVWIRIK